MGQKGGKKKKRRGMDECCERLNISLPTMSEYHLMVYPDSMREGGKAKGGRKGDNVIDKSRSTTHLKRRLSIHYRTSLRNHSKCE